MVDQIGWHIASDLDVISLVEGTPGTKKLMTVADSICNITRSRGATEASMVDHDMSPMTKVWFSKWFVIKCTRACSKTNVRMIEQY